MKKIIVLAVSGVVLCCNALAEKPKSKQQNPEEAKSNGNGTSNGITAAPAGDSTKPAAGAPNVNAPTASAPPAGAAAVDVKSYVIGAEDQLFIRVWNEAQLTGVYTVRPDGKISISLIGDVQAGGTTPESLKSAVTERLSNFINHPDVNVSVQQVNSKKYFIMGEVQKTGSFPLLIPTTVMEALVNAGGFRDFAKKNKIVIIRGEQRLNFNYNEVYKGKKREQNILLQPGDQIIVP